MDDILTASIEQQRVEFRAAQETCTEESRNSRRDGRRSCASWLS
jgi:hypothetical protein